MLGPFDVPRTFDNLMNDFCATDYFPERISYPAVDISEQEHETVVLAELPGVKKEDVKIKFENSVLTISGERKQYELPNEANVLLNEMRVRNFSRSFEFEHAVDTEKISAELNNGVLRVVLPKAEEAKPHTIEVK